MSETWYKVNYSLDIAKVSVEKSTEKCLFIKDKYSKRARRTNKRSWYVDYFSSFDEAKEFAINKTKRKKENAESTLQISKNKLKKLNDLKESNLRLDDETI